MEIELVVALELRGDALYEIGFRVQPRDLVLVLDREELEVIPRNGFGEIGGARLLRRFGVAHFRDKRSVARSVRGILVIGQECAAALDHLVE